MRAAFTACILLSTAAGGSAADPNAGPASPIELAHRELWRRFVDKHGVMIDFTDLDGTVNYPTPEECKAGKPNALGWFQPIENGAMFNGLYMDGAVNRWRHTKSDADAAKARKLMEGLLFLNSISDVKGFVGRGVSTDGKSHYPMGSNDQTSPWYYGLWRYWHSGPATAEEKVRIRKQLVETTDVIVKLGWRMPAEEPFKIRGGFGDNLGGTVRRLFVMKLMHEVTGEEKWDAMYRETLARKGKSGLTGREECAKGMVFEYAATHNWTSCCEVASLRGLWEMETDAAVKADFAKGLKASAKLAAETLPLGLKFDANDKPTFSQDWRKAMIPLWKPQTNERESQEMAEKQLREFVKISPRRNKEAAFIREPTAAAWIVTLCPDAEVLKEHGPAIAKMAAHFPYDRLYYCTYFWIESAWWRLQEADAAK